MFLFLFIFLFCIFNEIPGHGTHVFAFKIKLEQTNINNGFIYNYLQYLSHYKSKFKLGLNTHFNNLPNSCFINNPNLYGSRFTNILSKAPIRFHHNLKLSEKSGDFENDAYNESKHGFVSKWFTKNKIPDQNGTKNMENIDGGEETGQTESDTLDQEDGENFWKVVRPWTPGDDLKLPYMINEERKISMDKWPENCFLRIKLFSYYKHLVKLAVERIKLGLKDNDNLRVTNAMALPMRRKRWCYLSSAFVDKRSKDLIEIQEHTRVVDIVPVNNGKPRDFKGILMVPIPDYVSFDYWFEEVHKPIKSRMIHDLFRKRRWVSKYFLYHRDKHKKRELIEKITSPELINEIPLRHKRDHKEDYYFLQLGELRKLYNFIVARKAEDDARKFYNVRMPEIWQVDDVRFLGNYEDRMADPIILKERKKKKQNH